MLAGLDDLNRCGGGGGGGGIAVLGIGICLLDEMRVEVEAEAEAETEVHGPLWKPLSAKVHVSFRDKDC